MASCKYRRRKVESTGKTSRKQKKRTAKEQQGRKYKPHEKEKAKREADAKREAEEKAAAEAANVKIQPKSPDVEARLAAKYGKIDDLEEKAFTILLDLGMVESTSD